MITFIILTRDHPNYLKQCLEHLQAQTWQCWKAIVIDTSGPTCALTNSTIIKEYEPQVEHWEYCMEIGFAAKNNMGIKQALKDKDCKYICLLNDDAFINPNFVEDMINAGSYYYNVMAFSPLFIYENGNIQVAGGGYFTENAPAGEEQLLHDVNPNTYSGKHGNDLIDIISTPREIDFGYGAAIVYRKEVFEKIGFLDEKCRHGFDKPDFAKRMMLKGYKTMYVPTAVEHLCGGSSKKEWWKNLNVVLPMTYGYFYFLLKHYPIDFALKKERARIKSFIKKPKSLGLELYSLWWNIFNAQETRGDYHDLYDPVEPSKFEKEELAKKGTPWKRVKLPFKLRIMDLIVSYSLSIGLLMFCVIIFIVGGIIK